MYRVDLTTGDYYQKIKEFNIWKTDNDYFIFYWTDEAFIIIKKEYVISIRIM